MNVYAQEIPESIRQMVEEDEALVLKPKQEEQQREAKQKSRNDSGHLAAQHSRVKVEPPVAPKMPPTGKRPKRKTPLKSW